MTTKESDSDSGHDARALNHLEQSFNSRRPFRQSEGEPRLQRRQAKWNKACERIMRMLKRGRLKGRDRPPRRGAGYRGRLGQLLRELRVLFHRCASVAASRERSVSGKTRRERRVVMKRMLVDLYRGGYQLCHLDNFRAKHAVAILQRWTELGHASSTMATYVSHLRTFVAWLGKRELLPIIDRYCAEHPGLTRRRTATDRDKSERGAGVDYREIFRRAVATGDQYFVHQSSSPRSAYGHARRGNSARIWPPANSVVLR